MPLTPDEHAVLAKQLQRERSAATNPFSARNDEAFVDWAGSFAQSAFEDTVNLFGVPKSASNIAWEAEHPMSSLAAGFLGTGGVYGTFFKATKNLKRFETALDAWSGVSKAPVAGGALKEAMRFAPLEASRIVGTALGEPDRLAETFAEAGLSLGIASGVGALAGLPAKFGTVDQTFKKLFPNVDDKLPSTLKLRQLRELADSGKVLPENAEEATRAINQLDKLVRFEHWAQPKGTKVNARYVTDLDAAVAGAEPLTRTGFINSMFRPGKNKLFQSQLLLTKSDVGSHEAARFALDTTEELNAALSHLPKNGTSFMQYPRLLTVLQDKQKALTLWQNNWAKGFSQFEPGSYIGREADDGMFLMLKKIKGDPATVGKDNQFLLFKTDRPELFGGKAAQWADAQARAGMWWPKQFPQNTKALPGSTHEFLQKELERMPLQSLEDLTRAATPKSMIERAMAGMGLKQGSALSDGSRAMLEHLRANLAPAMHLFTGDGPGMARARRAFFAVKSTLERANATAEALVYGLPHATKGTLAKNLLLHGAKDLYNLGEGTVAGLVQKLSDDDRRKLLEVWVSGTKLADVRNLHMKGEISDPLRNLLERLQANSDKLFDEMNAVRVAAGYKAVKPKQGHYGLSHVWEGDWRLRIRNENGATVYMVGAPDRGKALQYADEVIERAGKRGLWKYDASAQETKDLFRRGMGAVADDWETMLGINTSGTDYRQAASAMEKYMRESWAPKALEKQHGIGGFSLDMSDAAMTKRLLDHYRRMQTFSADTALRFELGQDMLKLVDESPHAAKLLGERWNLALGIQGEFSKAQNTFTDKILSPYLGSNSASAIVGVANTVQHNLQLGSFNLMYPTVNMFTFMTTVLPQVSFVATAPVAQLQKYYTSLLAHGSDGLARKGVHVLDPLKMVYSGFRKMGSDDPGLKRHFDRALADGVFAPRLVEEHIGVDAQLKTRLKGLLQEKNGYVKFLQYVSEWLPNKSEQFSRLHAFTTGLSVGEDLLGLGDEALYRFARDFTHNTMFGYNMVDRARIIQGPLGSFFGLYKNWQMHYVSWLLSYLGEAGRGNFAPLLWSQAGVGALAGLGGTAAYGVADAFSRIATGRSGFDHVYNMFSQDGKPDLFSDAAFYGLPAFFGLSLQSSASGFGSNPAKDAGMLFSFVQAERGTAIGKAVGNAVDTWFTTGQSPFGDRLVRDQFLKAVAPRSIIRTAQVLEDDYIRSLNTGNPLIQGLSPMDRFIYGLGFNTPEMDRIYRVSDELFRSEEKRKLAVRYYARQLVDLQESKDWDSVTALSKRIMISGVGMDSVLRSAEGLRQRNLQDVATSRVKRDSPEYLQRYLEE